MLRTIYEDERYPDYLLVEPQDNDVIEVPDALVARYEAAKKEYEEVQREIGELYEASRSRKGEGSCAHSATGPWTCSWSA